MRFEEGGAELRRGDGVRGSRTEPTRVEECRAGWMRVNEGRGAPGEMEGGRGGSRRVEEGRLRLGKLVVDEDQCFAARHSVVLSDYRWVFR